MSDQMHTGQVEAHEVQVPSPKEMTNPPSIAGNGKDTERDSGRIGDISKWQTKRLGEVLQFNYGKSLPAKNRIKGDIPVYGSNGIVGFHNIAIIETAGLIIGRKGSAGQVHRSKGPFCPIDTTFYITAADAPDIDLEFLFYMLKHIDLTRVTGDVGVPGLNREMAYKEPVRFPVERTEQKKIAHILSTVQRAIEAQERIIQTTTELKKALMHKLFTEGLHNEPQKETEIGLVPKSWEVKAMNEICDLIIDCPHTTPRFSNSGVFIARNFNFKDAQFIPEPAFYTSEDEYLLRVKRATPMPGDVLFSREAPIGEACVIPSNTRLSLGQRTMFLRTKRSHLLPYFLVYSFYSENVRRRMLATAGGLTIPHLNVGDIRKMLIPVPSLKDQEGIINMLLSVERKKELHRRNLSSLQDLFRTLLYELMTEKICVH